MLQGAHLLLLLTQHLLLLVLKLAAAELGLVGAALAVALLCGRRCEQAERRSPLGSHGSLWRLCVISSHAAGSHPTTERARRRSSKKGTDHHHHRAAMSDVEDDSDASSDDGVQVILMQPDDEGEEEAGEEEEEAGAGHDEAEGGDEPEGGGGGGGALAQGGESSNATRRESTGSAAGAATPAAGAASGSRPKKNTWVNPALSGNKASGGGASATKASRPSMSAAQKAKFGPLAHVPGGTEMSFEPPLPDNIDIDQLTEKPWRKPEVDIADYFNYGFNEDTWRLYCKRQQEIRLEGRNLFAQQAVPNYACGGAAAAGAPQMQMQMQQQQQQQAMMMRQQQMQQQQQQQAMMMRQQQMQHQHSGGPHDPAAHHQRMMMAQMGGGGGPIAPGPIAPGGAGVSDEMRARMQRLQAKAHDGQMGGPEQEQQQQHWMHMQQQMQQQQQQQMQMQQGGHRGHGAQQWGGAQQGQKRGRQ